MAGIGSLFGGLAEGYQAGYRMRQQDTALQQHQQTIDLEKQKQDITLQQLQNTMADSKAIAAALAPAASATKTDAQGLQYMSLLRDAAGMDPTTRKTQLPVMFAQFKQQTGQDIAPNMQEFISKAPSETLVPLIDSATTEIARNGAQSALPVFTDPTRSAALIANRTAKLNAQSGAPDISNPQAAGVSTQVAQTQRLIDVETQKLQNLQRAAGSITTQAGLEKFSTLANATEQRIQALNGQLNALNTQNAPKVIGHGGALVTPTGQVLFQADEASKLLPPDVEAQQIRIQGAKAAATAQARQDVADASSPQLSPEAEDRAAAQYNLDGTLPPLGRGAQGVNARLRIMENAAQQAVDSGDTAQEAAVRATMNKGVVSGYRQLEAQAQKISAFENTAKLNADKVLEFGAKVDNSGVPAYNRWVNAGKKAVTDDPDLTQFNTYLNGFKNEYARIVTTATGGGVTTDSARGEFDQIINNTLGPKGLPAAIAAAKTEMDNRIQGFDQSRQEVKAKFLNLRKGSGGSGGGGGGAQNPDINWQPNAKDVRADGSQKGTGWLGVLPRPGGGISSEISIGVNIGGKDVEIPTLVPTLTEGEKKWLLTHDPGEKIPQPILDKAVAFAKTRISAGKSPFAGPGEGPSAKTKSGATVSNW